MKNLWRGISGPKMKDPEVICPQCHLYLVAEGSELCRSCEISNEIKKDFEEIDNDKEYQRKLTKLLGG